MAYRRTQHFLSVHSRPDVDMAEFVRFENQREPSSLAARGSLRTGKKSVIVALKHKRVEQVQSD